MVKIILTLYGNHKYVFACCIRSGCYRKMFNLRFPAIGGHYPLHVFGETFSKRGGKKRHTTERAKDVRRKNIFVWALSINSDKWKWFICVARWNLCPKCLFTFPCGEVAIGWTAVEKSAGATLPEKVIVINEENYGRCNQVGEFNWF